MESKSLKDLIENGEEEEVEEKSSEVKVELLEEALEGTSSDLTTTNIEKQILALVVSGFGISQIAVKLNVPESLIRTFLRNPKVKSYIKEVKEALNEMDQMMLTSTLRKIVGARIEDLADEESFSKLSKKDTLDIIKVFSDITNQISKSQVDEKTNDVFVNIYQQILEK